MKQQIYLKQHIKSIEVLAPTGWHLKELHYPNKYKHDEIERNCQNG